MRPLTERDVLALIRQRYSVTSQGTGRRYVVAEHVRDAAGFSAGRTLDAVVLDTWQSSGLALHGFEVKCSRGDWLRELRAPEKSERWLDDLDHMWLVAPADVVKDDLPERWGLLTVQPTRLVCTKPAPQLHEYERWQPPAVRRDLLATLLRAVTR